MYIDGEMPGEALQLRLAEIVKANIKLPLDDYLKFLAIDLSDGVMPDLSTLGGQIEIEEACMGAELIVVDEPIVPLPFRARKRGRELVVYC